MTSFVRFNWNDNTRLGRLDGDSIVVCDDDLFGDPAPNGDTEKSGEDSSVPPI